MEPWSICAKPGMTVSPIWPWCIPTRFSQLSGRTPAWPKSSSDRPTVYPASAARRVGRRHGAQQPSCRGSALSKQPGVYAAQAVSFQGNLLRRFRSPVPRRSDSHQLLLNLSRDPGLARSGEHVHLAAHAELRQIDAGLDGEAGVGQQEALIVGFKIIKMRAGAVQLLGDVVTRAMGKEIAETGCADHRPRRIVGLVAANRPALGKGRLHGGDGRVAGVAHRLEDQLFLPRRLAPHHPGPGDVIEDAARLFLAAPDVDEHKIAIADGRRAL